MKSQITEQHRQIARAIVKQGVPVTRALREAGVAPNQARKGWRRVAHVKALRTAVDEEFKRWAEEARRIGEIANPQVRAEIIRLRLLLNVVRGKDHAVQSCKILGQDREVRLFEPEAQQDYQPLFVLPPGTTIDFGRTLQEDKPKAAPALLEAAAEPGAAGDKGQEKTEPDKSLPPQESE